MRIVDFAIRRPVSVFIFSVAAVVFGLVAFDELAVDLLPDITYPSLTVKTGYEGAAPAEVESLVTRPVENAVGVVNNVVSVTSSSRADVSEVTLEFAWGTNMDFASLDVRERLDVLRLPNDADKPILLRYDPSLDPILRIGLSGEGDLVRLRRIAEEELKRSLERIEGVAAVLVSGGLEEEIQVELDERRMTGLGLSIQQVVTRLAQENINLTGGRIQEGQTEYLVRTVNEFLRPEDMNELVILRSEGAIIRLADLATIKRAYREREIITSINGRESVEIAVYKEGGTNSVAVSNEVKGALAGIEKRLEGINPSLDLLVITDQARYIRQSVREVQETAVLGGSLAILILFFFLRSVKKTLIISVSIPVSVIATFFLMYAFGISLNIMSLGGLTLGVGLLVDNSIVVLEAIQRKREEGELSEVESARVGASEVGRAVIASTLTTVCVFVPIIFVEGIAGQLFKDQALTVAFSLVVSLFVALTLIPMLASRELRWEPAQEPADAKGFLPARWLGATLHMAGVWFLRIVKGLYRTAAFLLGALFSPLLALFDRMMRAVAAVYRRWVDSVLRHRFVTLLITCLLFAGSLSLFSKLGRELVPELIQGEFFVNVELTPGSRLEVTERRMKMIESFITGLEGVQSVYTVAGTSSEQGGVAGKMRENIGQVTVTLAPPVSKQKEDELFDRIRSELEEQKRNLRAGSAGQAFGESPLPSNSGRPGALEYRFGRPAYFSFRTPIEVEIRGYNLRLLKRLSDEIARRMAGMEGLADVKSSTEGGHPELQVRFDRQRMSALGFNVLDVADIIRAKVQGEIATDITREDRTIDIRIRAQERFRDSVRDLANINISRTGTHTVPLSTIAEIIETEGPAEIRRSDGSRTALITANLKGRDLGSVSDEITRELEAMKFPSGFDWRIGGQRQEMETSFKSLRLAIVLAVFMVYLVMASQFESLRHPFVILFSVPFSVIGVLATLYLFDVSISIVALIGFILLAGIVVNDAIILVDYINQLRKEGMPKAEALRKAGLVRLRPILMTSATTVLGLLPMAIGLGEGSELRTPMALTVIGGLIASTALTLLIIPVVYDVLDRRP